MTFVFVYVLLVVGHNKFGCDLTLAREKRWEELDRGNVVPALLGHARLLLHDGVEPDHVLVVVVLQKLFSTHARRVPGCDCHFWGSVFLDTSLLSG